MKRLALAILCLIAALLACGCDSKGPRDTPEGTILALKETVLEGRADRLGDFIYTDNPDMRRLLRRTGVMLGNVQKLGESVQARFPDEVAKLKADAEQAAKDGNATSFLSQLTGQIAGQGRRRQVRIGTESSDTRSAFDDFIKTLMADPYGWAEKADTRLTTAFLTDDSVALLWDEKPILAPLGMTMRRAEDDRWYIVLPLENAATGSFIPHTPDQFKIFGSIIATFDNLVKDLRTDVETGRVANLTELSHKAGEKAFIPVVMTVFAYGNYTAQLQKEERDTAKPAPKAPGGG